MRAFMDYVLDWRLLHRTEPLVRSLAVDEALGPRSRTIPAPGGAEVFLRMEKPLLEFSPSLTRPGENSTLLRAS
jgi:hypothetical protein